MIVILMFVLVAMLVFLAVYAIVAKNLVVSVLAAGVVSLIASVIFLILSAPDVAITEAAIGSGLTTLIFLYVLNRIRKEEEDD